MKPGTILKDESIYVSRFPDKTYLLAYKDDAPEEMDWWNAKKYQESLSHDIHFLEFVSRQTISSSWLLPNKWQLNEIFINRHFIKGIKTKTIKGESPFGYWSCETGGGYYAWEQIFTGSPFGEEPGTQETCSKNIKFCVRLVRSVTKEELQALILPQQGASS